MASTLRRPPEHEIARFRLSAVGNDTVETYLRRKWSLAIICRSCPRVVEWTPPMLLERFGDKLDLPIAELVPRLRCTGPGGCGSRDIAVGPHLYDEPWQWPPALL